MNGFDLLFIGILTLTGGAILIVQGRLRSSRAGLPCPRNFAPGGSFRFRQQVDRHPYNTAGVRWLTIGVVSCLLALTRGRDTMFLVEHSENVLMPLTVLTVALAITSARAGRAGLKSDPSGEDRHAAGGTVRSPAEGPGAGRLAAFKPTCTNTGSQSGSAPLSREQAPAALSRVMQCPEDSFWTNWTHPGKRPQA